MKPPPCVVDRWAIGSLNRRPKGPFAVSWPRQLGKVVISFSRILDKVGRSEIGQQFLTICLFTNSKIGTTFAILKIDENIPNSKACLKHKDKIDDRIFPSHS